MAKYMLTFKRCDEDYKQRVFDTLTEANKVFIRLQSYIKYMKAQRYNYTPVEFISIDSVAVDHGNYSPIDFDILYDDKF